MLHDGTGRSGTQNATIPVEGKIHYTFSLFANFIENVGDKKLQKKCFTTVTGRSGTQNATSRWRAKSMVPIVSLQISLKTFAPKKLQKKCFTTVLAVVAAKMRPSRRRAKSTVPITVHLFANCIRFANPAEALGGQRHRDS